MAEGQNRKGAGGSRKYVASTPDERLQHTRVRLAEAERRDSALRDDIDAAPPGLNVEDAKRELEELQPRLDALQARYDGLVAERDGDGS